MLETQTKIEWQGKIVSIQPRTNVWRYVLDNRTHSYHGYNLFLDGAVDGVDCPFSIAISEKQQQSNGFHIGDVISGAAWTKQYPEREYADYYRAGSLKRVSVAENMHNSETPPWKIPPPDMQTYEWRGARMLSLSCWKGKCFQCVWASMSNVTIEFDFGKKQKYRFEAFCYGPKSCKYYKMGKPRAVPYKGWGTRYDDGWMDALCTENRGYDD